MMPRWTGRIVAIAVVVAIVGAAVFWWNRPKPAPAATAPPTPQVGVVEVKAADVALPLDFSGRVAGFRVVEIRAQVSGVLLKREYQEGAVVDVGQVLFRIDPRTYEAALARANAQAAQARATRSRPRRISNARRAWRRRGSPRKRPTRTRSPSATRRARRCCRPRPTC